MRTRQKTLNKLAESDDDDGKNTADVDDDSGDNFDDVDDRGGSGGVDG